MSSTTVITKRICEQLSLGEKSVSNTLNLLNDGASVPFIARYRKELTHSLSEIDIENIKNSAQNLLDLIKRKEFIIESIALQNKLSPQLKSRIENCWDSAIVEDLYLPYKKKKKTRATIAREKGLEGLAKLILAQHETNLEIRAKRFLSSQVKDVHSAIQGAKEIIAEWVSENTNTREYIRSVFLKYSILESSVIKSKKEEAIKYQQYFDSSEHLNKIPSHRLLATLRGHAEGFLKIKIRIDEERVFNHLNNYYIKDKFTESAIYINDAIKDSCHRLIFPSLENERLKSAKSSADKEAISVFSKNLRQLLLSPPLGSKSVLALDPGFRTGCKLVVLNAQGELLHHDAIFPHPPISKALEAEHNLKLLIEKFEIEAIAIGNGTAGKETYSWIINIHIPGNPEVYFVNESGASIYSASAIAREEFPDKDITVRGAVSIGRRLMDPLAELVKIDPKSIGVGQYQHDVNQLALKNSLDSTIVSCVNSVGINLNTASKKLLSYVSGLGDTLSQNIVDYRNEHGQFKTRKELLKVARMGPKAYEQCAGFLRIKEGKNLLDNTGVHPEAYSIVKAISNDLNLATENLIRDISRIKHIDLSKYITEKVGLPTLRYIVKELEKPGLDPRGKAFPVRFSSSINSITDLKIGMVMPGVVNNLTNFGAFIDIGIKESGLVHISQITNSFIKDPSEVLFLNQEINVKVIDIDVARKRVSLSIKQV